MYLVHVTLSSPTEVLADQLSATAVLEVEPNGYHWGMYLLFDHMPVLSASGTPLQWDGMRAEIRNTRGEVVTTGRTMIEHATPGIHWTNVKMHVAPDTDNLEAVQRGLSGALDA